MMTIAKKILKRYRATGFEAKDKEKGWMKNTRHNDGQHT